MIAPNSEASDLASGLGGVNCVVVAPFRDAIGEPDPDVAERITRRIDAAGIHAITILGNTAEVFQLSERERKVLLAAAAAGREKSLLMAGAAGPLTTCLGIADTAAELGYDVVMLHEASDPFAGEQGMVRLVHDFADRSPLPTVLYVRNARMGRTALAAAVEHPRIVGVKYAHRDLAMLGELLGKPGTRSACVWVCGLAESMVLQMRGLGIVGFTSGLANVRPDLPLAVWEASRAGDLETMASRVERLIPFELMRTREAGRHNVAVIKAALALEGFEAGDVRPPSESLGVREQEELRAVLDALPACELA